MFSKPEAKNLFPDPAGITFCPKCDYPVQHCECAVRAAQAEQASLAQKERDVERLGGLRAYDTFTLANYKMQGADRFSMFPGKSLYLHGGVGCGKTHLATALVRDNQQALVIKPQGLFRKFQGKVGADEFEAGIKRYVRLPMLVIDDIATQKNTEHSMSVLYEIIDGRWMNNPGGLIITSNVGLDGLARSLGDDRIVSRIAGMCVVVNMTGADRRACK